MGTQLHTHYDNLKVARNAPDSVIRAAYKALSQQYHPDKNGGDEGAARVMRLINQAYAELSDPTRRQAHDAWIAQQEAQQEAQRPKPAQQQATRPDQPRPNAAKASASMNAQAARTGGASPSNSPFPTSGTWNGWAVGCGVLVLILFLILINSGSRKSSTSLPSKPTVAPTRSSISEPAQSKYLPVDSGIGTPVLGSSPSPQPPLPLARGRVISQELNVRAGPNSKHEIVARLRFLDTITIEGEPTNGWLPISHQAGFGYVNGTFIQIGNDSTTLQTICNDAQSSPLSGAVLRSPASLGEHELRITAPSGIDAVVKLKDQAGRTILAGFVRGGDTQTFRGIPSGAYSAWFATGRQFSQRCGRFLNDMAVTFDPTAKSYEKTYAGNVIYSTVMEYSLQRQVNGNFRPSTGDPAAFLAD